VGKLYTVGTAGEVWQLGKLRVVRASLARLGTAPVSWLIVSNKFLCTEIWRIYCGRDKGMPNGRLYDREGMAMMGRQSLETRLG